jgi:uncharacterized protein YndB with AHSA1/START domain
MSLETQLRGEQEVVLRRHIPAQPARVFAAHTEADLVRQWMSGPEGSEIVLCEHDARPGGSFRMRWRGEGFPEFEITGEYIALDPPHRIEHVERMHLPEGPRAPAGRSPAGGGQRVGEQAGDGHRPTPPGTGVIAPATSDGAVEVDVAHEPACRRAPGDAVDADVDHRGAGPTQSPGPSPRPADGRDEDVGAPADRGRSRVREWAMVTVQLSRSSSCAIGLPTMFERPTPPPRPRQARPAGHAAASGSRAACRAPAPAAPVASARR